MASTMFATLWMVVFPTLLLAFLLTCEVRLICFFVFESKFVALLLTHVFEAVWILLAWKLILMALHDRKTSLPHGFIDTSLLHTAAPTSVNSKRLSSTPTSEGDALPEVKNMSGTKSEETAAGVSEPISNLVTMDEPSSDRNWPRAPQPKRLVERQKGLLSLIPAATVTKRKHKSVLMSKLQVEQRARDRKKTSTEVGRVHSLTAGSDSYKSASLARPPKRCQPNSQCTRPIRLTDLPAEIRNSIYHYAITSDGSIDVNINTFLRHQEIIMPPLARTSRVIRSEILRMVLANVTFLVYVQHSGFEDFFRFVEFMNAWIAPPRKIAIRIILRRGWHQFYGGVVRAADNIQYKLLTAKYSDFDIEVTAVATSCSLPEILECDVKFLARFFDFVAEYRRDFGRQSEAFMRRLLVLSPEIPAY